MVAHNSAKQIKRHISYKIFNMMENLLLKNLLKTSRNNINLYTINSKSVCNYFIRYEHLKEDIIKLCKLLDINNYNIDNLPTYKSGNRNTSIHYIEYYDKESQKIVYEKHKKSLNYLDINLIENNY